MSWSAPRTWVGGEVVTASIMNTHVRDNFNSVSRVLFQTFGSFPASGSGDTNVWDQIIAASTLGANGEQLEIEAFGSFAGNGNSKRAWITVGGVTVADTGTVTNSGGDWHLRARVKRTAATTARALGQAWYAAASVVAPTNTTPAITWTSAMDVEVHVQGGASSDLIMNEGTIWLHRVG